MQNTMSKEAGSSSGSTTARSRVREDVRRLILSGELRPGTRLTQQQLAKRFGVAQSVIRESLLELQFSGLVESVDNLGIFVSDLDTDMLLQAYEVREMLEGLAARLCCQRAAPAHVRELNDLAREVHALGVAGNDKERARLDRHFHERIIAICGNGVVARLSDGYHVVRLVVLKQVPHDQVLADHLRIVEAIRVGDEEGAERAAAATSSRRGN